jgi:hypothetical protein
VQRAQSQLGNGPIDDVACLRLMMTQHIYPEMYSGDSGFRNLPGKEWKFIREPGKPVECCRVCCGLSEELE